MPKRLQPMCFTSRLSSLWMDFMMSRTNNGDSLPNSFRYTSCELFGRFTASPSCRKSFISMFSLVGSSAYFTLKV